jgi:hypothetical protein
VKMKTMKSSLLEEEHGKGKSVLEMNHGSWRIVWLLKIVLVVVFVVGICIPKKYCNNLLSSLLGMEVVVGYREDRSP